MCRNSWMLQALQKKEHHSNGMPNSAELSTLRNVCGPASKHQEFALHQGWGRTVGAPDRCNPEKVVTLHEVFRREWHTME
ncbi:hypothetical protein POSPLADRAFT_1140374 [Postia placenta MAD-698-R-SB12]|uniref:Uncharacterized protein n=1 Tax=Postia placenta MAD-698-R-SB12 TaxID=670580 RepID=A0A1X6N3X6_9APHY|nr:hypothetical protein POSPLADRAFT_1140374 [Postia placenta MAD-698-R-SB12]OSX63314.1 hypothetical protein POSPLADRAFT_1140374 [Postia placenta MAD-698-R-SB12]